MYLPSSHSSDLLVIDFETTGIDPQTDVIVGVGIADRHFPQGVYFDICNNSELHTSELLQRIEHRPKIAHNISFEMIMETMYHEHMKNVPSQNNYRYCTQGLLNQLEGDFAGGYTRGESNLKLKVLQTELLGWEERGDVELDAWLVENGYHTNGKANKAEMWRAPTEILGMYCGLDAQSTWMLYDRIYRPVLEDYPELDLYHSRDYMNLGRLITEQRLTGMQIDKDGLIYYISNLEWMIDTLRYNFIHYSPAAPYIAEYNQAVVEAKIAKEPERTTKSGKESKNWLKWKAAVEDLKGECHFNLNSSDQKGWLFYDRLFKTEIEHTTNWKGEKVINLNIDVGGETVTLPCTATGKRPIDKEILPRLGEAGKVLFEYNKLNKELGYCVALLNSLDESGIHYTQLRLSGTKTDRCSGASNHDKEIYIIPEEVFNSAITQY